MPPKAKGAKKKAGGYQMPEKFTEGFVLNDLYKKPWALGKPIGQGGFGLIYLANKGENQVKKTEDADYVVKIEPKDNGPLFCETHFYINCAKEEDIKNYMKSKNLKHLAIPRYVSSGTCTYNEKEYRFLLMDRYQADVQSILDKSPGKRLNEIGVLCLMRQVISTLEYIHQRGYAHGDIKGANIMLRNDRESFLVDYGLAYRFMRDNIHSKYEIKPERRHNGTIEYTSRDAHEGAQINRRSDLEILAYCVIHWLCGTLPWIDLIKSPEQVQNSKTKSMKNVKEFLNLTLKTVSSMPDSVISLIEYYLNEINKLEFNSEPPYLKIMNKITETLKSLGHSSEDNFYAFNQSKAISKTSTQRKPSKESNSLTTSSSLNDESDTSASVESFNANKTGRRQRAAKTKEIEKKFIVDDTEEEENSDDETQDSKKSKIIYPGLTATIPKILLNSEKAETKSPRAVSKLNGNDAKMPAKRSNSKLQTAAEVVEDMAAVETKFKSHETQVEDTQKYTLRTTPKRQLGGTSATLTPGGSTHHDLISKFNSANGINAKPPRSPLTVASSNNLENKTDPNGPIMIKRKRNVNKVTVSTQTENSYLSTRASKMI